MKPSIGPAWSNPLASLDVSGQQHVSCADASPNEAIYFIADYKSNSNKVNRAPPEINYFHRFLNTPLTPAWIHWDANEVTVTDIFYIFLVLLFFVACYAMLLGLDKL
jgi:hypothetical protein